MFRATYKAGSVHRRDPPNYFPVLRQENVAFGPRPYLGTLRLDAFLLRTEQKLGKGHSGNTGVCPSPQHRLCCLNIAHTAGLSSLRMKTATCKGPGGLAQARGLRGPSHESGQENLQPFLRLLQQITLNSEATTPTNGLRCSSEGQNPSTGL